MKADLKRIESTLEQLQKTAPTVPPTETKPVSMTVSPTSDKKANSKSLDLPSFRSVQSNNITSAKTDPNPALALTLLQEIEAAVASWYTELQQILRQIQEVYLEGPIIEGWLECYADDIDSNQGILSHGDSSELLNYVSDLSNHPDLKIDNLPSYRLCGLDSDGKPWSKVCPSDQVVSVSMAIARYQKLCQLLVRKEELESRLIQISQNLSYVHSYINQTTLTS